MIAERYVKVKERSEYMKKLSSNTLFHFTSKLDYLFNILENNFSPRVCIENISPITDNEIAIPMVCFCDIPLSQIGNHSKQYGNYGIGLKKSWGTKKGVTPVTYYHSNSKQILSFINATHEAKILLNSIQSAKLFSEIMYSTWFYKRYEGKMWRNGGYTERNIRFYDEREWRYIPTVDAMFDSTINKYSFDDKEIDLIKLDSYYKQEINQELSDNFKLGFEPSDIKYIIVEKESEILEMAKRVNKIKARFTDDDKSILTTRIISMESIRDDF
jgi:hypothetical protein